MSLKHTETATVKYTNTEGKKNASNCSVISTEMNYICRYPAILNMFRSVVRIIKIYILTTVLDVRYGWE